MRHLSPVRKKRWVVYAKPPFAGPEAVLAYLSRNTHRGAISNSRLISFDKTGVTFRYKDYRRDGSDRQQIMTFATGEFIHRFLLHVLPRGFHRIWHYGLLAGSSRRLELPPESGPPTGIDYPSNWRISDGWKTREAGRNCIEASAG
ncbi:Putative transposase [Hoeflea sp. IMCC20628]|nr:Putative transposase [Hoeflea sp. IMCC20628]